MFLPAKCARLTIKLFHFLQHFLEEQLFPILQVYLFAVEPTLLRIERTHSGDSVALAEPCMALARRAGFSQSTFHQIEELVFLLDSSFIVAEGTSNNQEKKQLLHSAKDSRVGRRREAVEKC